MENKYILLKEFYSKIATNDDNYLDLNLNQTHKELPLDDLQSVINLIKVEQDERDSSNCYRVHGSINIVASNVLFNTSGDSSYEQLLELKDLDEESGTFVNDLEDVLLEKDGWFYYQTGSTCEKIYLEPKPERFLPLDNNGYDNWHLFLTYPYTSSTEYLTFEGVPIGDGIAIFNAQSIVIGSRQMTLISCCIKHGLNVGDIVNISSDVITGLEGQFAVYKVGNILNRNKEYQFVIDFVPTSYIPLTGTKLRFKKVTNNVESKYMVRLFKKITTPSDYEMFYLAYSKNKFNDQISGFNFKSDIDVEGLTDYLNRPLTELYITVLKSLKDTEGLSNFWEKTFSTLFNFKQNGDYDVDLINNLISDAYAIEPNILALTDDILFGDIVEYNLILLEEKVLAEAFHVFNSKNRVQNGMLEGYYYKPHHKIRIKYFSDYIEESASPFVINIPDYAEQLPDGREVWRDILTNSFVNDPQIPFVNNCHYICENLNIFIKRQDPCGYNNLGFNTLIGGKCIDLTINENNINNTTC